MATNNRFIFNVNGPDGTDVFIIDANGHKVDAAGAPSAQPFKSFGWATRQEPQGSMLCPESLDVIAIGPASLIPDQATVALGQGLTNSAGIASSSGFSSNVLTLTVNPGGGLTKRIYPFALVAKCCKRPADQYPTALEIWLSDTDFRHSADEGVIALAVQKLAACQGEDCPDCQ